MIRIALVTVTLQHYRLSFYEKLSEFDDQYQLRVFHGVHGKQDGRPAFQGDVNFDHDTFIEITRKIGPFNVVHNRGLISKLKAYKPDIVILPGIAGNLTNRRIASWVKKKQKKLIIWSCGWEPGIAEGLALKMKNRMVASYLKKGTIHLTYSTNANKYVQSMGIPAASAITCYNGIEIDDLMKREAEVKARSESIRKKYGLNGHTTFIYVGGLIREKRVDLLIDAFFQLRKRHEGIKLLIIGDGPEKERMIEQLERERDHGIHYLGRIVENVDDYFAASDCLVMPGIGGLALNQAMFWGKPCIVSEADGTEDDLVIEGKTGFRFDKGDPDTLRESMEKMIMLDPLKRNTMSEEARRIILTLSNTNHMIEVFTDAIRKVT